MNRSTIALFVFSLLTSSIVPATLFAESAEPSEIRSYRSLRTSVMKTIVADLEDDESLPNNWQRHVTDKVFNEIDKVQAKYRTQIHKAQSAGNAAAPLQEWFDWLSKEKLIWSGIKKELAVFANLHNEMLIGQVTIDGEIRSTGLLERFYDGSVNAADKLFEGVDVAIEVYNDSKFLRAINTLTKLASGNVDAGNLPFKDARSQLLQYLELVKTRNLVNLYITNRSLRQTMFERDLPARDNELKSITRSLDRQIDEMDRNGSRLIDRKLLSYNQLKFAVDISAFSNFEEECDAALKVQIQEFKRLEDAWDKMVDGWEAAMYTEHKGIARWLQPGFGNSAAVRRQLAEWYNKTEQLKELAEATEDLK
jgi:hypothetical protein